MCSQARCAGQPSSPGILLECGASYSRTIGVSMITANCQQKQEWNALHNCSGLGSNHLMDRSHFLDQLIVLFEREGLRSIGQSFLGLIMNLYD